MKKSCAMRKYEYITEEFREKIKHNLQISLVLEAAKANSLAMRTTIQNASVQVLARPTSKIKEN